MIKIRVGGVPEHFNLPWHLAIENKLFEKEGIQVEWQTFKGGTGAMTKALREDSCDVCILLTEGIIADIARGNPSAIISQYLNTPLIWGVFTGADNSLAYYGNAFDKNFAISRYGSGSHLMPQVDAFSKGLKIKNDQFIPVGNLEGAVRSLTALETDVFYWERYMTQPHVDSGEFRRLGEFVSPWPCFMIAATNKMVNQHGAHLRRLLSVIHFVNDQFMRSTTAIAEIVQRFELKEEDVRRWFYSTEWSIKDTINRKTIENVSKTLIHAGIIEKEIMPHELCVKV